GQVQDNEPIFVAVGDTPAVRKPRTAPRLTVTIGSESSLPSSRQVHDPQVPHLRSIAFGTDERQSAAIRRPARNRGEPVASDAPNIFAVCVRGIDATFSIPIGIERDVPSVR